MNQILDTKVIYITPRYKKTKKFYKLNFFISVFLVCLLSSYYIYAEYDKVKSEEMSKGLLEGVELVAEIQESMYEEPDTEPILMILDERDFSFEEELVIVSKPKTDGSYEVIASIEIPKIDVNYAILLGKNPENTEEMDALMKISPIKFYGADPNEEGNFCIAGHNYRNTKFFSKVLTLDVGDTVKITDMTGRLLWYKIYSKYEVDPRDTSCVSQKTNGRKEITLITCTNDNKKRVIVKAAEM